MEISDQGTLLKKLDGMDKKIDSIIKRLSTIEDFQRNIKISMSDIEKNTLENTEVAVKMSKYTKILDFSERIVPFLEKFKPKFIENFTNNVTNRNYDVTNRNYDVTNRNYDDCPYDSSNSDFDE